MKRLIFIAILLALAALIEKPEDHGWQTGSGRGIPLADERIVDADLSAAWRNVQADNPIAAGPVSAADEIWG